MTAVVFLVKFAEFYYHKMLKMLLSHSFKQKVDQDLRIYMDERSPCGLYITGRIKIYQYHMVKRQ